MECHLDSSGDPNAVDPNAVDPNAVDSNAGGWLGSGALVGCLTSSVGEEKCTGGKGADDVVEFERDGRLTGLLLSLERLYKGDICDSVGCGACETASLRIDPGEGTELTLFDEKLANVFVEAL